MKNIKEELLEALDGTSPIVCAKIIGIDISFLEHLSNGSLVRHRTEYEVILKQASTIEEYKHFFASLDKDGFLGSESKVWFLDGSWLEVSEDSGQSYWYHCKFPEIPKELCNV